MKKVSLFIFFILFAALVFVIVFTGEKVPSDEIVFTEEDSGAIVQEENGIKYTISPDRLTNAEGEGFKVPAIINPEFVSVRQATSYLHEGKLGLAITMNNRWRFYPFQILAWHEIVNDVFESKPIVITYCPLCGSAAVYSSLINGEVALFSSSGKVLDSTLIMKDDKTDSLWSQTTGSAISGEMSGKKLRLLQTEVIRWVDFKNAFPDGEVLSDTTGYARDYQSDPYEGYYNSDQLFFPVKNLDNRMRPKEIIYGLSVDNVYRAYPKMSISGKGVVNDIIGNHQVTATADPESGIIRFWLAEAVGMSLTFENISTEKGVMMKDNETGSKWNIDGKAISGGLNGASLNRIDALYTMWFAWSSTHQSTGIF